MRDLVLFVQFKKRDKYPWCIVTFSNKSNTPPTMFFIFPKLYNWYQIAQSVTCVLKDNLLLAIFNHFRSFLEAKTNLIKFYIKFELTQAVSLVPNVQVRTADRYSETACTF